MTLAMRLPNRRRTAAKAARTELSLVRSASMSGKLVLALTMSSPTTR